MSSNVEIARVSCGCVAVRFHEQGCVATKHSHSKDETVFCDTEDGVVWLHTGHGVTAISAKRARHLGDELHGCAQEVEKPR